MLCGKKRGALGVTRAAIRAATYFFYEIERRHLPSSATAGRATPAAVENGCSWLCMRHGHHREMASAGRSAVRPRTGLPAWPVLGVRIEAA